MLPVIYLKFKAHNLLGYLPEVLVQHLEEIYGLNRERNLKIIEQLKAITSTLNSVGISPLFMKGTGNLIDGVYTDIGERIIGDIDLLVREDEYKKAVNLVKGIGYANHWGEPRHPENLVHFPRLYNDHFPADLEIHRIPTEKKDLKEFNSEMINQQKTAVVTFPDCFVPSPIHRIIHLFVHSQLTNAGHRLGVVSLRESYDLYLISKKISLTTVIKQIKSSRKAEAYFAINQKLLGISLLEKQSITSTLYIWKHDLSLTSPLFAALNRIPWVISQMVFHDYPSKIIEAIQYKKERQQLIHKLGSRQWYSNHLKIYKKMITG